MKHLKSSLMAAVAAALLLASSGAFAQRMEQAAVQDTPSVLAPGVNAPDYALSAPEGAAWPANMQGIWQASANAVQGTQGGLLALNEDKTVMLKPEGMYELRGYWFVHNDQLVFDTPLDTVFSRFSLDNDDSHLTLTFSNGTQQEFVKETKANGGAK